MSDGFRRGGFVPVKEGDELEVKIEAVGAKGDGIAKKDGFVLFVPNGQEGQNVKIKVTRVLRKVGFAEIIGEGSTAPAEEVSEDEAATEIAEETQDEPAEDSEDFGEETAESEDFGEETEEKQEEVEEATEEVAEETSEEPAEEEASEDEEKKE